MTTYLLLVSFPLNVDTIREETDRLIELVGKKPTSSGAGFGMRDVDFAFDTADERTDAVARLSASPGNYVFSTHNTEDP
jgi:hypothetical protein